MKRMILYFVSIFILFGFIYSQDNINDKMIEASLVGSNVLEKQVINVTDDNIGIPKEYSNNQYINLKEYYGFSLRLAFDLAVIFLLGLTYYKARKKENILFALLLLNIIVYIVCYLLQSVEISIGFAFGIFAIFSILRYRTSTVPIREMTYIFVAISIAIINALTILPNGFAIMLTSNMIIILFIFVFEKLFKNSDENKIIIYNDLSLITPNNQEKLLEDLRNRTGLRIRKVEIGKIDYLNNVVILKIFY